jgi:hypothetical protein
MNRFYAGLLSKSQQFVGFFFVTLKISQLPKIHRIKCYKLSRTYKQGFIKGFIHLFDVSCKIM